MSFTTTHLFLVTGADLATCEQRVLDFLARTPLVRYDRITLIRELCCPARHPLFATRLEQGLEKNRHTIRELVRELGQEGWTNLAELERLPQGYPSKLVHTIAHLCDGFFGIDAAFYDLDEMSCRLRSARKDLIRKHPEKCWLVTIEAVTQTRDGFEQLKDTTT